MTGAGIGPRVHDFEEPVAAASCATPGSVVLVRILGDDGLPLFESERRQASTCTVWRAALVSFRCAPRQGCKSPMFETKVEVSPQLTVDTESQERFMLNAAVTVFVRRCTWSLADAPSSNRRRAKDAVEYSSDETRLRNARIPTE